MLSLNERNDSWQNLLTGLGTVRDKAVYSHYAPETALPLEYLEQLYCNDDIASRIVDLIPNEMLRQGFLINKEAPNETIKLTHHLSDTLIKARLFGAAFIYLGIEDGLEQHKPVIEGKVKSLKFVNVISAKEIHIKNHYNDALKANFGEPEHYELINSRVVVHESRLLPFYGTRSINPKEFPKSVLQRLYPVLQQFNTAWQATAHLMSDAAQGIFKLKGLHSSMSSNRSHELLKRMELVDMSRSISRSILLDAEDEDFRRDAYSFGGIPEILEKLMLRLSAAARIPVSLLMGQTPAGLNATGDSDIRFFYDQVKSEQEGLKPKIERIYRLMSGNAANELKIEFPALWQLTDKEQAEIKRTQAETDRIYLQEGVLLPEEISLMRFAELKDNEQRREILEDENNE
jgi:phage-related protein (TIGR01555 family)